MLCKALHQLLCDAHPLRRVPGPGRPRCLEASNRGNTGVRIIIQGALHEAWQGAREVA